MKATAISMNSIIRPVIRSLREIHCASWWLLGTVGAKILSVSGISITLALSQGRRAAFPSKACSHAQTLLTVLRVAWRGSLTKWRVDVEERYRGGPSAPAFFAPSVQHENLIPDWNSGWQQSI